MRRSSLIAHACMVTFLDRADKKTAKPEQALAASIAHQLNDLVCLAATCQALGHR